MGSQGSGCPCLPVADGCDGPPWGCLWLHRVPRVTWEKGADLLPLPQGAQEDIGSRGGGGTCWAGAEGSVTGTWCHGEPGVVGLSHAHPRPRCGGVAAGREGPSTQTAAPRGRQAAGAGLSLTPMGARCSHGGGGVGVTEAVMTAQDNSQRFWRFHGIDGDLGSALV